MRDIGWAVALCVAVVLFILALRSVVRQQFAARIISPIQTPQPLPFPTAKPWPTFAPLAAPTFPPRTSPTWQFPSSQNNPGSH